MFIYNYFWNQLNLYWNFIPVSQSLSARAITGSLRAIYRNTDYVGKASLWEQFVILTFPFYLPRWQLLLPELPEGRSYYSGAGQRRGGHELWMVLRRMRPQWSPWRFPRWLRVRLANHHQTTYRYSGKLKGINWTNTVIVQYPPPPWQDHSICWEIVAILDTWHLWREIKGLYCIHSSNDKDFCHIKKSGIWKPCEKGCTCTP